MGVVELTVVTADRTSAISSTEPVRSRGRVTVTGIGSVTGPPAEGTQVVISWNGLHRSENGDRLGGNPATFTVNSATQITATSPAGGGGAATLP